MSIIDNISEKFARTAKAAAKKSGEIVEITKLNVNISIEEEKITKAYTEIGRIIYRSSENAGYPESIKELCKKIEIYEQKITQMKQKILELKNVKICKKCGAELDIDVNFCSRCGIKQEASKPLLEEAFERVCPMCSTVNDGESVYCAKCGAKL